jgi:hypothetical protein
VNSTGWSSSKAKSPKSQSWDGKKNGWYGLLDKWEMNRMIDFSGCPPWRVDLLRRSVFAKAKVA